MCIHGRVFTIIEIFGRGNAKTCLHVSWEESEIQRKKKRWWREQKLYWQGKVIDRHSDEYQELLDRAFDSLSENSGFRRALLATHNAVLTHSIGKKNPSETILTRNEFCSRLTKIRARLINEVK